MHFIAGIGTGNGGVGGSFKFYNTGLGIDKQKVSIWKLIDVIKQKGGTPFAFWGVSGKKGWGKIESLQVLFGIGCNRCAFTNNAGMCLQE
jgi:hypothetical protein